MKLTVKNILRQRNGMKIIFLRENKTKTYLLIPYQYFAYDKIKIGEKYKISLNKTFLDNNNDPVENFSLTSLDGEKNFNFFDFIIK